MFRTLRPHQIVVDVSVPLVCVLLAFLVYAESAGIGSELVVLGMGAALALRRVSPALALGAAWLVAVPQVAAGLSPNPSNLAIIPVLFATSAYGGPVVKWLGFSSTFVGAAIIALYVVALPASRSGVAYEIDGTFDPVFWETAANTLALFAATLAVFLLSWVLGQSYAIYGAARASRQAQVQAEQQRQRARYDVVVEQERVRIARDMHDVVAHSLAVVIAQADGARYARAMDPAVVDSALTTISSTAREALGDVRILLGQLRHDQVEGPQRALDDVDPLIEQFRSSGLTVEVVTEGVIGPLGTGQQLALYRLVQEALTNALRHGDTGSTVLVRFRWTDDAVSLDVTSALLFESSDASEPSTVSPTGAGHGIAGMRERALLVGGGFSAGVIGQSFVVSAVVPRVPLPTASVPVQSSTPPIGTPA
ncbi:MAG: hypothetical protein RI885_1612 [Actinomycetota bacterium]|jgi:signal transduction histidine kinase